jgi:2-(1,2-epoxy-1,2-dihydrophenyl)acetyl-CoA isomerase
VHAQDHEAIRYSVDAGIATLTFSVPEKRNAMTTELQAETIEALRSAHLDRAVRAVVVTGDGDAFCAGGDVSQLGSGRGGEPPTPLDRRKWLRGTQRMVVAFRECEKPVLAAVNGVAAGGGLDIALACDIRIASDRARFSEIFARIGLFPGTGGTYLLPRTVGVAKALELIWTGDMIDAAEALDIGLVSRVVPHESLMEETLRFAARLAEGPPMAITLAKAAVYRGLDLGMEAALDYAATAEGMTLASADHAEGVRAFREKRPPRFEGR